MKNRLNKNDIENLRSTFNRIERIFEMFNINKTQLAESMGITRKTLYNKLKNIDNLTLSEMEKIINFVNK